VRLLRGNLQVHHHQLPRTGGRAVGTWGLRYKSTLTDKGRRPEQHGQYEIFGGDSRITLVDQIETGQPSSHCQHLDSILIGCNVRMATGRAGSRRLSALENVFHVSSICSLRVTDSDSRNSSRHPGNAANMTIKMAPPKGSKLQILCHSNVTSEYYRKQRRAAKNSRHKRTESEEAAPSFRAGWRRARYRVNKSYPSIWQYPWDLTR
jgi:hypothetical protein